jgi:hypothetical protein
MDIHFRKDPLGYKRDHIWSWNWIHTVSVTQGSTSKWCEGLNIHCKNQGIPNWIRKSTQTHTNTHTQAQSADIRFLTLWANFLTSIHWITTLNRPEVTEPQDTLVHSINSHNPNERFSFKDSYAYLNSGYIQWVWNSGYSKNFYKEQSCPNVRRHLCIKIIIQLRKIHEVTSFPTMSLEGRYTNTFRLMNK